MFSYLKRISTERSSWLLLFVSAICLELTSLYFQYGLVLNPCVMCVYERVALFGVVFAGIIGFIAPRFLIFRLLALAVGLWGAIKGLRFSLKHVGYQLHPNPWDQCPMFVQFPETLPLDKWFPAFFHPTGLCSEINWTFMGFTMPQWLVFIFGFYAVALGLILLSQLKKSEVRNRDIFR